MSGVWITHDRGNDGDRRVTGVFGEEIDALRFAVSEYDTDARFVEFGPLDWSRTASSVSASPEDTP